MEIRDEQRWQSMRPNFAALLALCVVVLIWTALSPIWIPCIAWLFSFLEPAVWFLAKAFAFVAGLFIMVMCPILVLAAIALVLGGGAIRSR